MKNKKVIHIMMRYWSKSIPNTLVQYNIKLVILEQVKNIKRLSWSWPIQIETIDISEKNNEVHQKKNLSNNQQFKNIRGINSKVLDFKRIELWVLWKGTNIKITLRQDWTEYMKRE